MQKQKKEKANIDMTQHVVEAFPTRAAQLRMVDAKEKSSEYWSKRRWYMEQERKKAREKVEREQTEERSRR